MLRERTCRVLHQRTSIWVVLCSLGLVSLNFGRPSQAQEDLIPLSVELQAASVNKVPFVIALEEGLYRKHGLEVHLWMPAGVGAHSGAAVPDTSIQTDESPDISVDGGTPMMYARVTNARAPDRIVLATTDCVVRWHIIARRGIDDLQQLKGKRLGFSNPGSMTYFTALLFAKRMGWDPVNDISLMSKASSLDALQKGLVDAFIAYEVPYAMARQAGYEPLHDMRSWNEHVAGNSIRASRTWLQNSRNREGARRFTKAAIEAIALFKQNPEVAFRAMSKWFGIRDRAVQQMIYAAASEMPRKPYPCLEGIRRTMEVLDSNEMRKHKAEDFYDDSIMREIDASGFIDSLYR